ncbi:MAG: MBL fold metallo-hydrolase [Pirellulales bacterium]|nr:MBL fold metallo-hydrolase [Pirellulales bacterium]
MLTTLTSRSSWMTLLLIGTLSGAVGADEATTTQNEAAAAAIDVADDTAAVVSVDTFLAEHVGEPQIVSVTPEVFVAVGYDLANVVLVRTPEGNVLIDTGSCSPQAALICEQMEEVAPGEVKAIVYTHGGIEQLGGAGVWVANRDVPVYGTRALEEEFLRQFVLLQSAEMRRGIRQFGMLLPEGDRTATAWGRMPEISQLEGVPNIRLPNQTFDDELVFTVGGVEFQLYAAPGESPDHLFVWIPAAKTLIAGDNFVSAFPKICGLRGSPQRNADRWIASLDRMRSLAPEHLISAHHLPISGSAEVLEALTIHRDTIQWLRDATLRAINRGEPVDEFAAKLQLPAHLVESPYLAPVTGCVEWAARTMYSSYVGWFDERPESLQPVAPSVAAQREIEMMGGADVVLAAANQAREQGDAAWAVHLLSKLERAGIDHDAAEDVATEQAVHTSLAASLEGLAEKTQATDAKTYLASMATELRSGGWQNQPWPCPSDETLRQVPLEAFFRAMALSLKSDETADIHETYYVLISDEQRNFVLTLRYGVLEVAEGAPLPGTPRAQASITTDGLTWRKMCLGVANPTVEIMSGRAQVKGNLQMVRRFARYFDCPNKYERATASQSELTSIAPTNPIP